MPDPYTRMRISGTLPGGEVWSTAPAFIGNFDTTPVGHADLAKWATDTATFLTNGLPQGLATFLSTRALITGVRAEAYGPDGKLSDYATAAVAPQGGSTAMKLPPTTAVVLSLASGVPGRRYRGRMYWPALGATLTSDTGRFAAADCAAAAAGAVSLLSGIESIGPAGRAVIAGVWSTVNKSGVAIDEVRVGDVPDSMRSRKDALVENYSIARMPAN